MQLRLTLPDIIAARSNRERCENRFAAHVSKMLQMGFEKLSESHVAANALEILNISLQMPSESHFLVRPFKISLWEASFATQVFQKGTNDLPELV